MGQLESRRLTGQTSFSYCNGGNFQICNGDRFLGANVYCDSLHENDLTLAFTDYEVLLSAYFSKLLTLSQKHRYKQVNLLAMVLCMQRSFTRFCLLFKGNLVQVI